MISMGCVEAGHLDGGGSTTLLSQHEGSSELVLRNNPCNGAERNVSTALMVVSNQKESGSFDHAAVQSAVDSCTPGAQVQFSVVGADSSGAWAQLPSDGTFLLLILLSEALMPTACLHQAEKRDPLPSSSVMAM